MEVTIPLEDVANIVSFIAPGYFAIQIYSLVYSKKDRDFSKIFIESVIYSLPIVTIANVIWQYVFHRPAVSALNIGYAIVLMTIAILGGLFITTMRKQWPLKHVAFILGLGSPNEDFVKTQLERVDPADPENNTVSVKLKSGAIFSGTSDQISRYTANGPMYYYFADLAWFNEHTNEWEEQSGGIIVERNEIEYIVTPSFEKS